MSEEVSNGIQKLYKYVSNSLGDMLLPQEAKNILDNQMKQLNVPQKNGIQKTIRIAYDDTNAVEDIHDLYERTCNRMLWQEMKKQKNIESVVDKTKELLNNENNISEQDVDEDWISRFFSSVQDISNEEMQLLWSKILAGEIKRPSTFSLRFLDVMTKVSQEEARMFEKYSMYMIHIGSRIALIRDDEFDEKHDIIYDDILTMQECNLIDANPLLSVNFSYDYGDRNIAIIHYNDQCITIETTKEKTIRMPVFQLTSLGKELFQIVNVNYDINYCYEVAHYLAKNNTDKNVSLYKKYRLEGKSILPVGDPEKIVLA